MRNAGTTLENDADKATNARAFQDFCLALVKAGEAAQGFNAAWENVAGMRCYLSDLYVSQCAHCRQGTRDLSTVADLLAVDDAEE